MALEVVGSKPIFHPKLNLLFWQVFLYSSDCIIIFHTFIDQPEFNQFGFKDDLQGGPAIWPYYISEDDYMVTLINAHNFIEHAKTYEVSDKFKKVADNLKETDNPVLVLVKLK